MLSGTTTPLNWLISAFNLANVGWAAFIYACIRVTKLTFNAGSAITAARERVLKGEETLMLVATNHLPHIQVELEKLNAIGTRTNELLVSVQEELKYMSRRED